MTEIGIHDLINDFSKYLEEVLADVCVYDRRYVVDSNFVGEVQKVKADVTKSIESLRRTNKTTTQNIIRGGLFNNFILLHFPGEIETTLYVITDLQLVNKIDDETRELKSTLYCKYIPVDI